MPELIRTRLVLPTIVFLLLGSALVAVGLMSPASAASCTPPAVMTFSNGTYVCTIPGGTEDPGDPDDDGGGQPAAPCPLQKEADGWAQTYADKNATVSTCNASMVCLTTDFVAPLAMPKGPKPNPDSEAKVRMCFPGGYGPPSMEAFWSDEADEPSLLEQAQEAIGNIDLGQADIAISPTNRTLVNLDTWYWLDGGLPREAVGSSAFGLRAIATFESMSVDPGDGSGEFGCPYVTSREAAQDSCTYTYRRSSRGGDAQVGGRPAYTASITTVYSLRFEVDGRAIPSIPGAPTTLDGPTADAALRVDEVQSRVTGLR